ncbi:MAG: hypothetical protein KF715_15060 [Candidatus Didemnitutus sp.]|nr:hypothetical protein [Candidatus Didemnitutus sp.]
MANAQKDTHTHAQKPGFLRLSEAAVERDATSLAKMLTGFSRGPFGEMTRRELVRYSVAYRAAKLLPVEQRDAFIAELRRVR